MHHDGTCTYEFDPTPIMSTYLVAFVIGAYDYVETRDMNQVLIRVYTPAGKKEQGLFALKVRSRPISCVFDQSIDLSTIR